MRKNKGIDKVSFILSVSGFFAVIVEEEVLLIGSDVT